MPGIKLTSRGVIETDNRLKTTGLLKAVIDAGTNKILREHFELHEMINIIKFAMGAEIAYTILRDSIYTHHTITEVLNDFSH